MAGRRSVSRSGKTGRFVKKSAANGSKRTTTSRESVGGRTKNKRAVVRDLSMGRFVKKARGDSDPSGTMTQRV